jgi:hypothetical protein
MKRRDDGKVSLVEFLRSIKFRHQQATIDADECPTHFAGLDPRKRTEQNNNTEESHLIRSAN